MIEIGQNLKEVLNTALQVFVVIVVWIGPIYLIESYEYKGRKLEKITVPKKWWSIDNPVIYIIASTLVTLILVYVFRVKP